MTFGINRLGYVSGNDYDDPYAPWNEHRDEIICDECDGVGYWYEDSTGYRIDHDEYNSLGIEQRDEYVKVYCNKCEGEGHINY